MLFIFNSGKSLFGYSRKKQCVNIKIKNKNYITVETITKSNIKVVQRQIQYTNTQIHERALTCLVTGTPIKRGDVKLVLRVQAPPPFFLSEMIQSCKCFPRVSEMPTVTTGRITF